MNNRLWWLVMGGLLLAAMGGALAWYDYHSRHGEAALLARAHAYWEAIRSNDLLTAYHLEAEAAAGNLAPHDVNLKRDWGIRLVSFQLGAASYQKNKGEVTVTIEQTYPDSFKTHTNPPQKDAWTFINGQWYHGTPEQGGSGLRRR